MSEKLDIPELVGHPQVLVESVADPAIVGQSPKLREVLERVRQVAPTRVPVVIHGESGTGKELVARAIHRRSHVDGPFVAINCAAIPEPLQDSELFGHERGAFTGAHARRAGRFEQAHRGTLLLDEVAELSPALQAKLLRVLQERCFERIGGNNTVSSDFRLIVASHASLPALVKSGAFRRDLYFRLAVFQIDVPPLREREGDLPVLVDALLERIRDGQPLAPRGVCAEAMACLQAHTWPGNVRELENVLRHASVVAQAAVIQRRDLPTSLQRLSNALGEHAVPSSSQGPSEPSRCTLVELERWAVERTLKDVEGNVAEAARRLGIAKTTLYRKLRRYGLQ